MLLGLSLAAPAWLHAGSMGTIGAPLGIEAASEREITRRQEDLLLAEQALKAGDAARARKDAQQAYSYYKQAADMVPQGSAAGGLRGRVISRFSQGSVEYAEYLVSRGAYAEARAVASEVLEPRYNPNYRPAIVFLSHLEEADYFNKTVTPEFAAQRDQVEKLIQEAVGFYDSGRYDMAQKRYQQVLAIDKDNAAAYRGLEQTEVAKQRYYESAYNETRARMLWQADKAWERPKPKFTDARASVDSAAAEERRGTELMLTRLNQIIIPRVDFRDAPVQDAIGFLRRQSREQANGADGEGINIVLELPPQTGTVQPAVEGEEPAAAPSPSFSSRISLSLSNVPLYEALRYVALQAGLKVKVEPFAVSVVPLDKMTDSLEVREFRVPPGFISATTSSDADQIAVAGSGSEDGSAPKLSAKLNARDFLESQGVEFPPGASARFIAGSSRLVLKNTAANLDLVEALVEAAMAEEPVQVEIESKFVDVSQDNLKELGFDWTLGPFSIGGSGIYGGGGNGLAADRGLPFVYPGTSTPVGDTSVTGGLRTGRGSQPYSAISVNSIDAILARSLGVSGPAPGIFSIAGVFTNPQFQVLIRALNQKKGIDLMAAPKVTTKSGQKATITISREFPYPQEFEPPQIPQDSGGQTGTQIIIAGQDAGGGNDPIVTPSFPTDFTTRNLGVTLEVEPQIGPDGYTIDLTLSPEVVDFDGFINYGSPIYAPVTQNLVNQATGIVLGQASSQRLLTDNIINQPIFSKRKATTSVTIWDGQTVALGGLIREDIQKVSDKVPLLGDIPLAGVLFRSEVEQKIKSNLIIFTTARLMDAAGQLLRPQDDSDQEEVVEPLGLPPEIKRPDRGNPKGGLTRK